jgi:putative hemolysin
LDPDPLSFSLLLSIDWVFWLSTVLPILILLLLLSGSGFVSGSEVAFFALQPADLRDLEKGNTDADRRVLQLLEKPKELLATILISNNLINVGIVILSSYILSDLFGYIENALYLFLIEVVGITFLILLFGEILPKVYASRNPMSFARKMSSGLYGTVWDFRPLSHILVRSGNLLDKGFVGGRPSTQDALSVDDLSQALELTQEPVGDREEQKLLEGIVRFGSTNVKQVMTQRLDVMTLDKNMPYPEVLDQIRESGFSRIPVYEESFDNIVGLLYIKDLLPYIEASSEFDWNHLLRKPFYVPESKKIDDLLQEFRNKRIHMAIVVDEFGGTSGLITLEDVIEEIVGDISDEFDDDEVVYSKLDDQTYSFEGKTPLNDFYKVLDIEGSSFEEEKGESDTLAGFVLEIVGVFPEIDDVVEFDRYRFTVEAIEDRRIQRVKVECPEALEEGHAD